MTKEREILAQLTNEDLARIDKLANERGISREEMLRSVIVSGLGTIEEQRRGVKGPGVKGGA